MMKDQQTDDDLTSSDDEKIIVNQQPKNRKKQATDSPGGWDMKLWKCSNSNIHAWLKITVNSQL